jgi:outer membrane protein TolC
VLTLLASLAVTALPACGPLDLDTALALVASRSDEMAIKRSELAAAEADLALAKAARWIPDANATFTFGPSPQATARDNPTAGGAPIALAGSNRGLGGVGVFGRVDINVIQPLYTFGRLDAARDAATAGVQARRLTAEDTASQLDLRVRKLFWGEALARRGLDILGEVEKALAEVDKTVQDLLQKKDPSVSIQDRYRIEVFRGQLLGRQAEARKGLEQAHIGLAATLGANPEQVKVRPTALPMEEGDLPDATAFRDEAVRRRPDLAALDQAILAKQAEVRAQEAAYKPQFFILGNFSYGRADNRDIVTYPWAYDPINVFSFGAILGIRQDLAFPVLINKAEKSRAELATLEDQRRGLARLVNTQVDNAVADLKAARDRLLAARASRDAGRSLFRSASLDFAVGLVEAKDLLSAYREYIENQAGLAYAAYDLAVARAQLVQTRGERPERGAAACELY